MLLVMLALGMTTGMNSCSNMSDGTLTRVQGTTIGTLGGGAVGAGVGALVGGKEGAAIGGGVGSLFGAAIGWFVGDSIAKQKKEFADEEAYIRENSRVLDNQISAARSLNTRLSNEITRLRQENRRLSASEVQRHVREVDECISRVDANMDELRRTARTAKGAERASMNQRINTLVAERNQLRRNRKAINDLAAR